MRVISRPVLLAFGKRHKEAESPLAAWWSLMRKKRYRTPHELRSDFPAVDFLGSGLTVFDIGGNKYRLVAHMRYDLGIVFIRNVVTHAEYDKLKL